MNSEPRIAEVRVGTAMIAARRQRTRQLLSAIRDRVAGGRRPPAAAGRVAVPGWPAVGEMAAADVIAWGTCWVPRADLELGSVSRLATAPSPVGLPSVDGSGRCLAEIRPRSSTHYARTSHRQT